MQPLPQTKAVDYTEVTAVVSSTSTIEVRRVTYTVPSRLIGERLLVRIYNEKLLCYIGSAHAATLPRASTPPRGKRGRQIDYRHVIDSLVKKPGAFRSSQLRNDLLPNDVYRYLWDYTESTMDVPTSSKFMLGLLYLAAKHNCQDALGDAVMTKIHNGEPLKLIEFQNMFAPPKQKAPQVSVHQHVLEDYNKLIPRLQENAHGR